ncbi:MAG TPA: site-2 protease family protein, partial [Candidatus Obscuribacter sp.]|nr:site-2 protease family protein [Candidatus Obscuribacter sp.]
MFEQFLFILLMLGVLSVLIIVHECGHYLVARFFGFQTPVFGIGLPFGPHVVVGQRWGTEFRIYACLLGGFVAIPELGDETNAGASSEAFGVDLNPFKKFPIWQRALVAVAGVTFNVIFAYFLMVVMLLALGRPIDMT